MKLSPLMSLPSLPFLLVLASPSLEPLELLRLPHEQAGLSMSNLQQLWPECRALKRQHQLEGRALKRQHQLEGRRASLQVAMVVLCCPSKFAQLRFLRHIFIKLRACVQRQLMATKRKDEEVDPLDLGDGDIEMEYDKMDNLREMLAKSSVAITYQVTRHTKLHHMYKLSPYPLGPLSQIPGPNFPQIGDQWSPIFTFVGHFKSPPGSEIGSSRKIRQSS